MDRVSFLFLLLLVSEGDPPELFIEVIGLLVTAFVVALLKALPITERSSQLQLLVVSLAFALLDYLDLLELFCFC